MQNKVASPGEQEPLCVWYRKMTIYKMMCTIEMISENH